MSMKEEFILAITKEVMVRKMLRSASPNRARLLRSRWSDLLGARKGIEEALLLAVEEGRTSAARVVSFRNECLKEAAANLLLK